MKKMNISSDVQPTTIAHQRAQIKKEDDDESMDGQRGPSSRSTPNLENTNIENFE